MLAPRVDMMAEIRALCALPARLPGAAGERLAHEHVAAVLTRLGLAPVVEEFRFPGNAYAGLAAHTGLLALAGLVGVAAPSAGAGLAALASASLYGDLQARFLWLRRLFPHVESRNVVARIPATKAAERRVVLMAHVDVAREAPAVFFEPSRARQATRLFRRFLGAAPNPVELLFWAGVGQSVLTATAGANLPARLPLVPLAGLQATVAAVMARAARAPAVPGASDNASGVAVMLALADRLAAEPLPRTEVWLAATGCEEAVLGGAQELLRRHEVDLDRDRTVFIALDTLGAGRLRYCTGEGFVDRIPFDRRLLDLCATVAATDGIDARPYRMSFITDALVPASQGYRALSFIALDEDDYPPNYHWHTDVPEAIEAATLETARDFLLALLRRVDSA